MGNAKYQLFVAALTLAAILTARGNAGIANVIVFARRTIATIRSPLGFARSRGLGPLVFALVLSVPLWPLCVEGTGGEGQPSDVELKAAYVFNLARFVKWPAGKLDASENPFILGVVGDDRLAAALETIARGKEVSAHKVIVQRFTNGDDLRKCHLLYLSREVDPRLRTIFADMRGEAVLTVGQSDKFIVRGGMINLMVARDLIGFEINPKAAEKTGLKIDSRLLRLARIVDAPLAPEQR